MTTDGAKIISEIGQRIRRRHATFVAVIAGKYAPQCRARGRARLWHLRPLAGNAVVPERLIERRALVERWLMQPLNVSVALQNVDEFGSGAIRSFNTASRYFSLGRDRLGAERIARLLRASSGGGVGAEFGARERAMKFRGFPGSAFLPNATPLPVRAGKQQRASAESRRSNGFIFRDAHLFSNFVLADFVLPVLRRKDVLSLLSARHMDAPGGAFPRRHEFDLPAGFARPGAQRLYADVSMSAATDRRVEAAHGTRGTAGMVRIKFLLGNNVSASRQPRVSGARAMVGMGEQPDVGRPGSVAARLTRDGGSYLSYRSWQGVSLWRNRLNFVDLQMAMSEPNRRAASGFGGQAPPTNMIAVRDGATGTHTRLTADMRTFATLEQRSFPFRNGNARQVLLRGAGAMQGKLFPSALGNEGGVAHVAGRGRTAAGGLTLRAQGARTLPTFSAPSRWARFVASGRVPSDGARGHTTAELVLRPAVPPAAATEAVAEKSVTQTTVAARINGTPTNAAPALDIERIAQQVQTLLERKTRIERTRRGL